ncbi:NAD(P)/FAD-dependent oxidoreductase [Homoserinibacter sp. YIM 151385]|uniref:NAD(P)/FAD-dependent oxidoreductase n=1 Tax=Homoserinibacter sp. YIM 151385 TaxID=2985506 RepID=UPI0022F02739|nr:FAD/NAD(P)-binding oxidoreductase [Homoserinibacter sp. YIM 151385]WBU37485.1 FAD/NAD(P)-binding oxidoreductase [Homoserinibacter sp. YIM 151385]
MQAAAHDHHAVLVVGGGNGGSSTAGRLRRAGVEDVAIIEPRPRHLYQPLFSHVAGGTARASRASRPQEDALPRGVRWIRDAVVAVDPGAREVELESGARVGYGQLVLAPGMRRRWDLIPGLAEAIETPAVSSHYELPLAAKTSRLLRDLHRGTVVFTEPAGPASCAGASQKPMYLACDHWRRLGVLDDIRVVLVVPTPTPFGIPMIDEELSRKIDEYGIEVRFGAELVAVEGEARVAVVRGRDGVEERIGFDVLNAVPPQRAPEWIAESGLGDAAGFADVDPELLRHRRHPEIWALGDAAETGASRSGGALRKQTKALAENLAAVLAGRRPASRYYGYSVAPFTVSRRSVVFAEFDRELRQRPTVPGWRGLARERTLTWILDRHVLPRVYWHLITKGRA